MKLKMLFYNGILQWSSTVEISTVYARLISILITENTKVIKSCSGKSGLNAVNFKELT
jgi:hypothetical protein